MTSLAKIIALALISIIGFYGAAQEIDSVKLKKFDSIKQEINTVCTGFHKYFQNMFRQHFRSISCVDKSW